MMAIADDATFGRAERIIARSYIVSWLEGIGRRLCASIRASRVVAAVRRQGLTLQAMPAGERSTCAALVIATAAGGHIGMASLLPAMARPRVMLTALLLVSLFFAAAAIVVRRR